jgi:hypothetical protein
MFFVIVIHVHVVFIQHNFFVISFIHTFQPKDNFIQTICLHAFVIQKVHWCSTFIQTFNPFFDFHPCTCEKIFSTSFLHGIGIFKKYFIPYTPRSMRCDSRASLLAHTLVSPNLGCEPKARVATMNLWTKAYEQDWIYLEWNEPSHSQMNCHFGSWSPNGLPNLQRVIVGVKTHWI